MKLSAGNYDRGAVRAAILREGLCYLAHGLLFPFSRFAPAAPPQRRSDIRTLVFVHGLAANRSSFLPLQLYLRARGYDRQVSVGYRSSGSLGALSLDLKRRIDDRVRGGRIDIIAHSMGGLLARFYVQQLGGQRRVDRLITLGTPHRGTHAANFIPSALLRQLLPDSPFIELLAALPAPEHVTTTSLVAGRDILVQPIEAARCPFGDTVHFDDLGHLELLFRPQVFQSVAQLLGNALDRPVERRNGKRVRLT